MDPVKSAFGPTEEELKQISSNITNTIRDLEAVKRVPLSIAEQVAELLNPCGFGWDNNIEKSMGLSTKIFDGVPIASHTRLSDGLFGWLVAPSLDWMLIIPSKMADRKNTKYVQFLQELTEHMYDVFKASNFYEALITDIRAATSRGTSVIMYEKDPNDLLNYINVPFKEFFISENRYGVVDRMYRKFKMTCRNILEEFNDEIESPEARRILENAGEKEMEVINAVYPTGKNAMLRQSEKPYISVYKLSGNLGPIRSVTGYMHTDIMRVKGMDDRNFDAWRFEKVDNSPWGTCPAFRALYDMKMINMSSKAMADAEQLAGKPPLYISDSVEGDLHIFPGGYTYGPDNGRIEPIFSGSNLGASADLIERRTRIIQDLMSNDYFQSISAIQNSSRERTETEILEIKAEGAAKLCAALGRIERERLAPMVRRTILNEIKSGRAPKPPEELLTPDFGEKDFSVMYTGPLFQAQRKAIKLQDLMAGLGIIGQIAQSIDPDVVYNLKPNWAGRQALFISGFPAEGIEDEKVVDKARESAAAARAEMAEREMRVKEMQVAQGGVKAPEPGSPLEKKMRQEASNEGVM